MRGRPSAAGPLPDLREGQQWFLPGNARRPARMVVEISEAMGYVDFADARGERRCCLESAFRVWALRYGARVG